MEGGITQFRSSKSHSNPNAGDSARSVIVIAFLIDGSRLFLTHFECFNRYHGAWFTYLVLAGGTWPCERLDRIVLQCVMSRAARHNSGV